jgi:acetyl-CoA hydrolase
LETLPTPSSVVSPYASLLHTA